MQLKVKTCARNLGWQPPAVICNYTEKNYNLLDKCPDGYVSVTDEICLFMHPQQSFKQDICNGNIVPFTIYNMTRPELNALFTYLRDLGPGQLFWLPAKQVHNVNVSLQIGLTYAIDTIGVQWTIPAYLGELVLLHDDCPTCTFQDHGGCLAFVPTLNRDNRFNTSVINCNVNHLRSFCLFKMTDTLHRLACPDGYVASLMPVKSNIQCSAIHRFSPLAVTEVTNDLLYEYCPRQEAYQLNSVAATFHFEQLAKQYFSSINDRCLFGISPWQVAVNGSIFMDMLFENGFRPFVNWDISMGLHDFDSSSNDILSANNLGKWFWVSDYVSCIVCTEKIEFQMPKLELKYTSAEVKLTLKVINGDFLLTRHTNKLKFMCFAKVHNHYSANLQATKIADDPGEDSNEESDLIYDIKLIGPGNYWCIGHVISMVSVIGTETLYAQGIVMSMMVEFDCRPSDCHDFANLFRRFLYSCKLNDSYVVDPTHIQFEDITFVIVDSPIGTKFLNILFHVTVNIVNEEALRNEPNILELSDEMLTYYYIRQKFVIISNIRNESSNFRIRSVNSTNFCLPSSISVLTEINWLGAGIGEIIGSVEGCIDSNGRPIRRMCVGDVVYGAAWFRLSPETECNLEDSSDLTDDLQYLVDSFQDPEQSKDIIEKVRHLVTNSSDRLVRMDIFIVSKIVGRATSFLDDRSFSFPELQNLVVIYNNLMQVDQIVARSSAAFNSTNVLLDSLELILIHRAAAMFNTSRNVLEMTSLSNDPEISKPFSFVVNDPGIVVNTSPMFINFVIDPKLTDVSGVAVLKPDKDARFGFDASGLIDYSVQYLYRNQSLTDLLLQPDLQVASFIPNNVLHDILATLPDAKLVFSVFYNDILFQTVDNKTYIKSDGKIIAVSIPGLKKLPGELPIYVKPEDSITDYCGYWDYNNSDGWSETGCYRMAQNPFTKIVLCVCNHLTHFAYLLKGNSSQLEDIHLRSLQGITVLGCTLSLIGILGIYVTAINFRSWRSKSSTKYLLQLSTAIAFQMILLAFVNTAPMTQRLLLTNNEAWCIVFGVLLHYFVLAMFFWMLIIAYLQFIRYVIVFNHVKTPRFLLKSSLLGWTLPMVPVLLVVIIDSDTYVPDLEFSESQICYPSGYSLYFGILLPIGVIVGANLVIFILVNYNLLRGTNAVCRAGDRNSKLSQLRLSIFLFFLLGLTWIFGLMSTAFSETSIVFAYLFCLTSTFQGFVMFLYFVIMDPVARNLWIYFFKRLCFSKRGNIDIRKDPVSKESY